MPEYLAPGVYVEEVPSSVRSIAGVSTSTAGFIGVVPDQLAIPSEEQPFKPTAAPDKSKTTPVTDKSATLFQGATLCTNFTEYTTAFGRPSVNPDHRNLTQAVYGFFNNGGTRCYVVRLNDAANIGMALDAFELVDDIAIVAAPGISDPATRSKIDAHCKKMGNRFAILMARKPAISVRVV